MEQENKYYIPDIEDFRVGYEYERLNDKTWNKETLESHMLYTPNIGEACDSEITEILRDLHDNKIRVLFLTKEQIENEGWIQEDRQLNGFGKYSYFKKRDYLYITFQEEKHIVEIHNGQAYEDHQTLFEGECKSINELRYISKLLNINKL